MGVLALRKSKGCLQVLSQSLSLLVTLDGSQNLEMRKNKNQHILRFNKKVQSNYDRTTLPE